MSAQSSDSANGQSGSGTESVKTTAQSDVGTFHGGQGDKDQQAGQKVIGG